MDKINNLPFTFSKSINFNQSQPNELFEYYLSDDDEGLDLSDLPKKLQKYASSCKSNYSHLSEVFESSKQKLQSNYSCYDKQLTVTDISENKLFQLVKQQDVSLSNSATNKIQILSPLFHVNGSNGVYKILDGKSNDFEKQIEILARVTEREFNFEKFITANGYANDNKDNKFMTLNWHNSVKGYLPFLGRHSEGVKLNSYAGEVNGLDSDKGYIVPLRIDYFHQFFKDLRENDHLDKSIITDFMLMIFTSDPGSADNDGYNYNNTDLSRHSTDTFYVNNILLDFAGFLNF